jgi:hypothetical protein
VLAFQVIWIEAVVGELSIIYERTVGVGQFHIWATLRSGCVIHPFELRL